LREGPIIRALLEDGSSQAAEENPEDAATGRGASHPAGKPIE